MQIKIDVREVELIKVITGIPIIVETLPIGDVIFCDDDGTERLIIERKTVADLLSSIKDGRYDEQSCRLTGHEVPNHNIYYLVEGPINKDKQLVFSSIFSLGYYKGFSVMRTSSVEETAFFIQNTFQKMTKDPSRAPYKMGDSVDYVSTIKKVKSDNITPGNINELMLSQIPGISSQTAKVIMEKFHTLHTLIEHVKTDDKCLDDVTYTNTKGDKRKINKTCLANIKKFLLPDHI